MLAYASERIMSSGLRLVGSTPRRGLYNVDGFLKNRIILNIWIFAFAGMTIKLLISTRYNIRHTREGGYPGGKVTFCDFINIEFRKSKWYPIKI